MMLEIRLVFFFKRTIFVLKSVEYKKCCVTRKQCAKFRLYRIKINLSLYRELCSLYMRKHVEHVDKF